jgi:hypothetical protein
MKNIHVFPTNKEPIKGDLLLRHLWKGEPNECISWWRYNDTAMYGDTLVYTTLNGSFMDVPSSFKVQNIYITNSEEVKKGDWCFDIFLQAIFQANSFMGIKTKNTSKKIILTTDQYLIADGVQDIDDDFLEWFVQNPTCESVETYSLGIENSDTGESGHYKYEIIIPQEESKQEGYICPQTKLQCRDECCVSAEDCHIEAGFGIVSDCEPPKEETIEEVAANLADPNLCKTENWIAGALWQKQQDKKMYSEEEVRDIIFKFSSDFDTKRNIEITLEEQKEWFKNLNNK